ncbi:hypothetical protein QFZ51_004661 [Chitinophaga sp. W3I9]|uniref:hypothetical protein n=1 Tax=Chitinophaga sp. W3I9 TaxID=3373924 RepID=UPI003D1C3230
MNKSIKEMNVLFMFHAEFIRVAKNFRDKVCEECNYSTPTFYRKMRGKDKVIDGKMVPVLSNAEKDKIREIGVSIKEEFISLITDLTVKK